MYVAKFHEAVYVLHCFKKKTNTTGLHDKEIQRIITRPRVSDVVNKKSIKFTIDALVDMLARTGKHIQLSVR